MKTVPEEFEDDLIAKDDYIEMKCTNCGYEEEMPDWVYGEEALFLREEGITDPPCWNCPKCHQDSLYRKSIVLNSKQKHQINTSLFKCVLAKNDWYAVFSSSDRTIK